MNRGSLLSRLAALLLLLVVLAAGYVVIGVPIRHAYDQANREIAANRLQLAIAEREAQRRVATAAALQRGPDAGPLVLTAASDSSAAASLQTALQSILETHAAQLVSIETLPGAGAGGFRSVRLRVQFSTDHLGLPNVLHALEAGRPVVFLENLTIHARSSRATGVDRPLDVQVDLTAFRALEG